MGTVSDEIVRKVKHRGFLVALSGGFIQQEILGPPFVEHWAESYAVPKAGVVMPQMVTFGRILAYLHKMDKLYGRFGPTAGP